MSCSLPYSQPWQKSAVLLRHIERVIKGKVSLQVARSNNGNAFLGGPSPHLPWKLYFIITLSIEHSGTKTLFPTACKGNTSCSSSSQSTYPSSHVKRMGFSTLLWHIIESAMIWRWQVFILQPYDKANCYKTEGIGFHLIQRVVFFVRRNETFLHSFIYLVWAKSLLYA